MTKIAKHVEKTLASERVVLTMGGEPTFIPTEPEGPEWHFAAVGPTKLGYARAFAEKLVETVSPGAMILYSPGKLYPGEVNPRWALQVLHPDSQEPFGSRQRPTKKSGPDSKTLKVDPGSTDPRTGTGRSLAASERSAHSASAGLGIAARFQGGKMDHGTMEHSPG